MVELRVNQAVLRSLLLTERMDLYIGVAVTLMFVAGCSLAVVSVRQRSEERRRWRGSTFAKTGPAPESKQL
jgi:hypothetical protein